MPDNPLKIIWDILAALFIIYQSITVPYKLSFDVQDTDFIQGFEIFQDIFFIADIAVSFFTGYFDETTKTVIIERRKIVTNYFKFWFSLDLASSFPYSLALAGGQYFEFGAANVNLP